MAAIELDTCSRVKAWLDDVGLSYREGGVTGPALDWSLSLGFGGTTHVSLAHDTDHPRRIEVMSDLAISDDHKTGYARLSRDERTAFDRRLVQVLLRRSLISFQISRDAQGAPEQIAMRAYLPIEGLAPLALVTSIFEARNSTMDLCVAFQDGLGGRGALPLDKDVTDSGYTSVLLQTGTLETLGAFQIPGETLDETILRAVRE